MTLATDKRLGPYEIISPLGAGGMGEVWRARDTRLDREVAIKVLPASFAQDVDRLRRFKQEALATSSLNHPNILTVYDIGDHEGTPFIVAELLEGEELREQLNEGALPVREALNYAKQITQGLAAAHEKGIIHRDLKPENLFITQDGRVKILDFGLAKLKPQQAGAAESQAPTQKKITDPGTVMGTVGYMSPEQVRGQGADHRADIFSFGVILYEMLSGKRTFGGESAIEVMNAILKEEPPELCETNAKISPALDKVVRRCLEKKPERRFQTASDLGFALEALSTSSGSRLKTAVALPVRRRERLAWLAVALLLVMLGLTWAHFTRQPKDDPRVMKFSILPPEKSSFEHIAVSPDGHHLAFTAATGGKVELWVRPLNSTEARPLAGTQGATFPFWSPDSRFIGFFADGRLKKIEVTGGPVQTLCEAPAPNGGAWSRAGVILFGRVAGGLSRISEMGGEVTQVTTPDRPRLVNSHPYPTFLPDGRHFLYSITSAQKETSGVYLGSLDGAVKRRLLDINTVIKYVAADPGERGSGGWLVFVRDGALLARPFDTSRLDFTGEPFSLSDKVGSDPFSLNYFTFSVSDNGVLVFDPSHQRRRRQYRWEDRRGQQKNSLDVVAGIFSHRLSPDEKRFIADRFDPRTTTTTDLWLYDVSGGNEQRFTLDLANDFNPVWSPKGDRIVWASSRDGGIINLYQKAASFAGKDTQLLKSDYPQIPTDWSRDGHLIIYNQGDPKTKSDVWALPAPGSGEPKPFPLIQTEANEGFGTLSPDGRWLAYVSDVSGRFEVWVQSFSDGSGKRQVSNGGGNSPRWRSDGSELFYYSGDGKLMAAKVRTGESFEMDAPVSLFEFRAGNILTAFCPYAVTRDGQRFLINAVVDTEQNAPLTVVVNWAAGAPK
jgi:serine/threonine protein kinase/Tol biopolymer transport system component